MLKTIALIKETKNNNRNIFHIYGEEDSIFKDVKPAYTESEIQGKIPVLVSVESDKIILTFIWRSKGPQRAKMLLKPTP